MFDKKCSFVFFALAALFLAKSEARVYQAIDSFGDGTPPLFFVVTQGDDTTPPYDWFSPYYETGSGSGGDPPVFQFRNTVAALGGQRDTIAGYVSVTPQDSVGAISFVRDLVAVAFPLNYVGGAYFQWDGDDTGGNPSAAFPGARLNSSPGIGQGVAFANGDGSIDFTFGGQASGIYISVKVDNDINYFFDTIDSNEEVNSYNFLVEPRGDQEIPFFFRFDDPNWTSSIFDWTKVKAFQVRILTLTGGAYDTEFRLLRIAGYQISGNVALDATCDGSIDSFKELEQVDLFESGNPTPLTSTVTDVNGNYAFTDSRITSGNYTICLNDRSAPLCPGYPVCRGFTVLPLQESSTDITGIDFIFFTPPSNFNNIILNNSNTKWNSFYF